MATHKSAMKRMRQDQRRRLRNKAVRTRYRNLIKAVRVAAEAGDAPAAQEALKKAAPFLQRAASKGVIHRNKASRHVSRLTRQVHAMTAEAPEE